MTTKPQPGEYWQHKDCDARAYIIGRTPDDELVWQCKGDAVAYGNEDWSEWQHLPDCTGWDHCCGNTGTTCPERTLLRK